MSQIAVIYYDKKNDTVCSSQISDDFQFEKYLGAMSKAQATKIKKVYDLALKTGCPVVAFYNSNGGRLDEGNALLAGYGDVLNSASKLSGVVPQISVILGK